ncbi:MAG: PilN domain-containing protein [Paenisporosarcina sp.]
MHQVDINLIQTKTNPKEWLFISVFFAILLTVIGVWLWSMYQDKIQQVENLERSIASQVNQPVTVTENSSLNEYERYETVVDWASAQPYSKVTLLVELSKKLPARGYFTSFVYSENSVELEVQFDTHAEAAFYLTSIQQSPFITEARILSLTKDTLAQETAVNEETFVQPRTIATYSIMLNKEALKDVSPEQEDSP